MAQNENTNENIYNRLTKDISDASKKVGGAAEDRYNQFKEKGREMAENMEEKAYQIGSKTREVYEDAEEKLKRGVSCLEGQVREHPILSVTIAMMVGGLLTKIFSKS